MVSLIQSCLSLVRIHLFLDEIFPPIPSIPPIDDHPTAIVVPPASIPPSRENIIQAPKPKKQPIKRREPRFLRTEEDDKTPSSLKSSSKKVAKIEPKKRPRSNTQEVDVEIPETADSANNNNNNINDNKGPFKEVRMSTHQPKSLNPKNKNSKKHRHRLLPIPDDTESDKLQMSNVSLF